MAERHAGLFGEAVGLARIASHAGRDDVLPVRLAPDVPRDDVVEVELLVAELAAAVLAGVRVAQVDVAAGEADLAARHAVVFAEQEHAGDAQHDACRAHGLARGRRRLDGEAHPLLGAHHAVAGGIGVDRRGAAAEQQAHRAQHADDVNRLPETVKDEDALFEARRHWTDR